MPIQMLSNENIIVGDIVNRRIVDYFAQMTSPETLCSYLESFKQSFWPNGKNLHKYILSNLNSS